jgi:hypothetical protein
MNGNAGWDWSNFTARFDIAKQESINLFLELKKRNLPVELISLGLGIILNCSRTQISSSVFKSVKLL